MQGSLDAALEFGVEDVRAVLDIDRPLRVRMGAKSIRGGRAGPSNIIGGGSGVIDRETLWGDGARGGRLGVSEGSASGGLDDLVYT